jgi:hypothetical protein
MTKTSKRKKSLGKKKLSHESPLTAQHVVEQSSGISDAAASSSQKKKKTTHSHKDIRSKKSQKRARREAQEDLEEEQLTNLLFGNGGDVSTFEVDAFASGQDADKVAAKEKESSFGFEIDRTGQEEDSDSDNEPDAETSDRARQRKEVDDEDDSMASDEDQGDRDSEGEAPAWQDPDDGATTKLVDASYRLRKLRRSREETEALSSHELEKRLRERYEDTAQGSARTDWAKTTQPLTNKQRPDSDVDTEEDDSDDEALNLFNTSKSLLASSRNRLPPNILNIVRCPDANQADPNKAVVRAVNFHPGSDPDQPLMLTAGLDKNLRFFQIGEEKSEKIHGIHCKFTCR